MAKIWLNLHKKTALWSIAAVFLLLLDRYWKSLALANFSSEIVGKWLTFSFMPNYGIAFSLPLGGKLLNLLIVAILAGLAIWGIRLCRGAKMSQFYALLVLMAGAFSNLADRLIYGFVIDYLDLKYFTVFNLADIMIVLGVAWLAFHGVDKR